MTTVPLDESTDLALDRELRAPRERVWAALTDPTALDRWWGPSGFRTVKSQALPSPTTTSVTMPRRRTIQSETGTKCSTPAKSGRSSSQAIATRANCGPSRWSQWKRS